MKRKDEIQKEFFSGGKVSSELLEHGFNTADDKMPELTVLSSREVFVMAGVDAINRGIEDAAKTMEYQEYKNNLRKWESYPTRLGEYEEYIKAVHNWEGKSTSSRGERPISVRHPGEKLVKPAKVDRPELILLPDIYNLKYMRYKRSQDGLALKELYSMGKLRLEVDIEEGEEQEPIDSA